MSNSLKGFLAILIVAITFAAIYIFYLWPHLWWRVDTLEVGPQVSVTVYESSDENLLFWLQEDSLIAFYIFDPITNELAQAHVPRIHHFLPGLLYFAEKPVPVADSVIKLDEDINIVMDGETNESTARRASRIATALKKYQNGKIRHQI